MISALATLRQTPQIPPTQFLAAHPGSWMQYYDDTEAKDPAKALSARSFSLAVARRKQRQRCAVCFSLQAFGDARTKEGLLVYRNLGVDVDLVSASERRTLPAAEIDRRKDDYLTQRLLPFPLKPHWLIETGHGFHVIFRIMPQRKEEGIREAAALNRRLVSALRGDENAALLTQVLRVPGTYQFKDPGHPFLCRLLINNADTIPPYDLAAVRSVLDAWEVFHGTEKPGRAERSAHHAGEGRQPQRGPNDLDGVPEGRRNATAAAIVGGILGRLPEHLWETAGWGGLKEWNQKNSVPLPERELRAVHESIERRERAKRQLEGRGTGEERAVTVLIQVDVSIQRAAAAAPKPGEFGNGKSAHVSPDPR